MTEVPSVDKINQTFASEQRWWRARGGRLRLVLALAIYMGCICGFGLLGMLPISRNMVLHPDGAGGIAPLLHILAVVHGISDATLSGAVIISAEPG